MPAQTKEPLADPELVQSDRTDPAQTVQVQDGPVRLCDGIWNSPSHRRNGVFVQSDEEYL